MLTIKAQYHGSPRGDTASLYTRGSKFWDPCPAGMARPVSPQPCPGLTLLMRLAAPHACQSSPCTHHQRTPHTKHVPCSFGMVWLVVFVFPKRRQCFLGSLPFPKLPVASLLLIQYPKSMPKIPRMSLYFPTSN